MSRASFTSVLLALFCLLASGAAQAADHSGHAMPQESGHGAMQMMNPDSVMLGEQTVEGVTAMAHINAIGAMMAQMGHKETHHLMVMFSGASGDGTVAVKITDPAGRQGAAIALTGMGGHYGADLALAAKGDYVFQVGSKLADNTTRQFTFRYTVK